MDQERSAMQAAGESLDRDTGGRWVSRALADKISTLDLGSIVVVDSVRIIEQINGVRSAFGARVVHVHITASEEELERRYKRRKSKYREFASYQGARSNPTEAQVDDLAEVADIVIKTDRCTEDDVLVRTAAALRLIPLTLAPVVDVLIGGQYGSEGKGNIASHLAPEYDLLIRVGGPNAGHKVYEEPEPYTFHQLPSGTRHSEADLAIGPGAVIGLETLLKEINECDVSYERLSIDPLAGIIEDWDVEFESGALKNQIGLS